MRQNQVIAIIALLAVIGLVVWYGKKPAEPQPQSTNGTVENRDQKTSDGTSATNFNTISREDWKFTAQAEKDIQALGAGQKIEGVIVQDPNDEKTYYFAAQVITSEDPDDFTNFLSVYRYDIPTRHFERLFRQTYSKENPYKDSRPPNAPLPAEDYAPVFQLRGYDQGQLIFFIADSDYSPGYCFDPLLLEGSLVSLSIKSPYSGFKIYNAADDLIAKARAEEQKCRQEFESQF